MKQFLIIFLVLVFALVLSGCAANNQTSSQNSPNNTQNVPTDAQNVTPSTEMVDCSTDSNPSCFLDRLESCLPTTTKMTGTGGVEIIITVYGYENEKCHFQRKVAGNSFLNLDCFFPKGALNSNVLDQTFGNDHGLQKVVDDSCNTG